ncbi:nucleolar complex-associated protein-domain-containing protein [Xylogone sp. PMI_703]|nr:nucleolar complex-associated protein-domain-containing protein [Xylogone sp. PMI_703]
MAGGPATKRRKLSPPSAHDEDSSRETGPKVNAFFRQAASWNLEQDYENRPRKGKKKEKVNTRLPIKTAEGVIQQVEAENGDNAESDLDWLEEQESDEGEPEVVEEAPKEPAIPIRKQILEAKEELARIALLLNENPEENAGAFKTLAQFAQSEIATIKKLALATQLAVYKDVIPGYRIRPLSEEDMEVKVSKDVRRVRNYEQALVSSYQVYIRELAKLAQSGNSDPDGGLATIAIGCACTLLTSVPHFNFRGELLKILVNKLSTRKVDNDFIKCRETIEAVFQNDEEGTASLDAVSLLTKMMKARSYRVHESVLNTFLHLRLLSEFSWKASINHVDKPGNDGEAGGKKSKKEREFRTKKQRKFLKEQKAVEKEMKQADAIVSHEERDRMQAETLKLVFVTYFRILKLRSPDLMGAVLEGLAKYAHLINQDFFGDILEALKDLILHAESGDDLPDEETEDEESTETGRNLTREALLCIITAFALLEGQDAAKARSTLHLDLSFFITHLYRTLHALSLNPDIELSAKSLHLPDPNNPSTAPSPTANNKINIQTTTVLLLRSLSSILVPQHGARAVPPLRIAAYTKQLMTMALHLPEKSCTAVLGLLGKVSKTHEKKIASLWNTEERRGDGTFDPLNREVEASNPFASTIWEGEILRKHYCPAVRDGVKVLEKNILGLR